MQKHHAVISIHLLCIVPLVDHGGGVELLLQQTVPVLCLGLQILIFDGFGLIPPSYRLNESLLANVCIFYDPLLIDNSGTQVHLPPDIMNCGMLIWPYLMVLISLSWVCLSHSLSHSCFTTVALSLLDLMHIKRNGTKYKYHT